MQLLSCSGKFQVPYFVVVGSVLGGCYGVARYPLSCSKVFSRHYVVAGLFWGVFPKDNNGHKFCH